MTAPPNRRLLWVVRLVFYPVALGLIALAWHQRQADADGGGRTMKVTRMTGTTAQDERMTAELHDGVPGSFRVRVRYRCAPRTPSLDHYFLDVDHAVGGADRLAGERVDTEVVRFPLRYDDGWDGLETFRTRGRWTAQTWTGTIDTRVDLTYEQGQAYVCRASGVRFRLRAGG